MGLDGRLHVAAMEPAVERREHATARLTDVPGESPAAMEPAVERREHSACSPTAVTPVYAPQWSPPLRGGSTFVNGGAEFQRSEPQWSPPLRGGSTSVAPD